MMTGSKRDNWEAALFVLHALRARGYQALLAGGCVRDRLLGIEPKDYDVATNAPPESVLAIFPRGRKVGAQFGVILVRKYGFDIEVATFRTEGDYSDGRRPDRVIFGTAAEDARRRDFTINGLFLDPDADHIIDYVGGRADLDARILRTIGDPRLRFAEDHLRMLRAVRFAGRLGFTIEAETLHQIQSHAERLRRISPERIRMELEAILEAPTRARGWELILETGLRPHLSASWPVDANADQAALARYQAMPEIPSEFSLTLASALYNAPPEISDLFPALRLSNRQAESVRWLVACARSLSACPDLELADLKLLMARPDWPDLIFLLEAIWKSEGREPVFLDGLKARAAMIDEDAVAPPPFVTGDDLLALGLTPGRKLGRVLDAVYRAQLNEEITDPDAAMTMVRGLLGAGSDG
ncbi:MAG: CCA tRNA nucleotidyltransferase [Phycisphaerae bacterium]|nr:CCA tRNA nucleotidyltransferase [Phycisphaerae bacterium]